MTALPYQPVPTAAQQRELSRWVSRHYQVRQYEQTQALISPVEAAGVACCATNVADEATHAISEDFVISVLGVSALVLLAIFLWLGVPA